MATARRAGSSAASACPTTGVRPAAARALVRSVLEEAGLDALLNEALLLTTELSTNAVVHASTDSTSR